MRMERTIRNTVLGAVLVGGLLVGSGRDAVAQDAAGKAAYDKYCASCHGVDGKGQGPAAASLKNPLPDLTQLARSNKGEFPTMRVLQSIDGTLHLAGHGSREMPVWGEQLQAGAISGTTGARKREVLNFLVAYVRTLQAK